jgi:hypothetical protein
MDDLLATTKYHKIQGLFKRVQEKGPENGAFLPEFTLPEFEYLADLPWCGTEKVDGTNIRLIWDGLRLRLGGRTERAQIPGALVDVIHRSYFWDEDLWGLVFEAATPENPAIIYGEGYGGKIQKGQKYRQEPSFVAFDVRVGSWWLTRLGLLDTCSKMKIQPVPMVFGGSLWEAIKMVKEGFQSAWWGGPQGPFNAEGLVLVPEVPLMARNGRRIITKLKTKDRYTEDAWAMVQSRL